MEGSWGVDILGACCSEVCLGGGARELGWVKCAWSCRNIHMVVGLDDSTHKFCTCTCGNIHDVHMYVHAQYMHDM